MAVNIILTAIVAISMASGIVGIVTAINMEPKVVYSHMSREDKHEIFPSEQEPDIKMPRSVEQIDEVIPEPVAITLEPEQIPVIEEPPVVQTPYEIMSSNLGEDMIDTGIGTLVQYDLPTVYYPGLDFSSFQPYMSYKCITNKASAAYKVVSDERMYVDDLGMCRFKIDPETQFSIDGQDDYVIALGTFYKPKGTCGDRWLIVTSTGEYTATTGDEKADAHTDPMNMYSCHADGSCAGIIEWLVDTSTLQSTMKRMGTITKGPIEAIQGEILYIYRIE